MPPEDVWVCRPITSFPAVLRRLFCKFSFCSSDPCGQMEPREDDKSDHSRVSPRLRDNPAVCHLNSFGGGRALAGERWAEEQIGALRRQGERCSQELQQVLTRLSCSGLFVFCAEECEEALCKNAHAWHEARCNNTQRRAHGHPMNLTLCSGDLIRPVAVTRPSVQAFAALNGGHNKCVSLLR